MAKGIKTGGRDIGTPNKLTKELKEIIKEILEKEFSIIDKTLQSIDPEKRLETVLKLLPYVVPKLQNIQSEITNNDFMKFNEPLQLTKEQIDRAIDKL